MNYNNLLNFDEFVKYFVKYKRFPNGAYSNPEKKLNELQLQRKFKKYIIWHEKQKNKKAELYNKPLKIKTKTIKKSYVPDAKMKELKEKCLNRAGYKCEFWEVLTREEKIRVQSNIYGQLKELDPIHVISRSQSKKLYYDEFNIIIGMRYFHSLIDTFIDPITRKHITKEERENWFIRVMGLDRWEYLQNNK